MAAALSPSTVAEIPLAVDERIACGERLGQAHERVVNRLISVGWNFADDIADDAGALLEAPVGIEPELPHRVQQPAMDGLQAIARVGRDRAVMVESA